MKTTLLLTLCALLTSTGCGGDDRRAMDSGADAAGDSITAAVGETYWTHCRSALTFAALMLIGALACAVHAFLPFLCVESGSRRIRNLHDAMLTHRRDWRARDAADQRA